MAKDKTVFNQYIEYCEKFKEDAQQKKSPSDRNDWLYVDNYAEDEAIKLRFGFDLYYFTKDFLEKNKDALTPEEKGGVFTNYVNLWQYCKCRLTFDMVGVAEEYGEAKFGKRAEEYMESSPMTVGFNLSMAVITPSSYFLLGRSSFLAVNLKGAKLVKNGNEVAIYELDFKDCDMTGFVLTGYFEDIAFHNCNLEGSDFSGSELPRGKFEECNLRSANIGQQNSSHFLSFVRHCVTSNSTAVFRSWNSADTPQVNIAPGIQNFDNESVIPVWKEQLEKGNSVPIAFRRVLTNDYEYMKQVQNSGKSFEELLRAKNAGKKLQRILRHEECNPKYVVEAVKEGASLDLRTDTIWSCASYLVMAVGKGNVDVAVEILRNSKNPKKLLSIGYPVHYAALRKDSEMLKILFSVARQHIDVDRKERSGRADLAGKTALDIAVEEQCEEAVKVLLDNGANPQIKHNTLQLPLIYVAARARNASIVKMLVEASKSNGLFTHELCQDLLIYAMNWGDRQVDVDTVKFFIAEGAKPYSESKIPFMWMAVETGKLNLIALFIENGAEVNLTSKGKTTPLHRLWRINDEGGAIKAAKMLIDAGADLSAKNEDDKTPYEVIIERKPAFKQLAELLKQREIPSSVVVTSSIEIQGKVVENIIGK